MKVIKSLQKQLEEDNVIGYLEIEVSSSTNVTVGSTFYLDLLENRIEADPPPPPPPNPPGNEIPSGNSIGLSSLGIFEDINAVVISVEETNIEFKLITLAIILNK